MQLGVVAESGPRPPDDGPVEATKTLSAVKLGPPSAILRPELRLA